MGKHRTQLVEDVESHNEQYLGLSSDNRRKRLDVKVTSVDNNLLHQSGGNLSQALSLKDRLNTSKPALSASAGDETDANKDQNVGGLESTLYFYKLLKYRVSVR